MVTMCRCQQFCLTCISTSGRSQVLSSCISDAQGWVCCCKVARISCHLKLDLMVSSKRSHPSFAVIAEPVASRNEPLPASTTEQQVRHDCFFLCLYTENDCGSPVGSASKYWLVNVSQCKWLIFYRRYQICILQFCLILSFSAVRYYGSLLFMEVVSMWVAAVVCWMRESWLFCLCKCV